MKRAVLYVVTLWILALTFAVQAAHATPPVKTVAKLTFARLAPSAPHGIKLLYVKCAPTPVPYVYVCAIVAKTPRGKGCVATYVHYNRANPAYGHPWKVNLWSQTWPCMDTPPVPPQAYPGDGGPRS